MKIKDIKEPGFYEMLDDNEIIFEVLKNTDEVWLKAQPECNLILDEWIFDHIITKGYHKGKRVYQTSGGLYSLYFDLAEIDVEKIKNRRFKIFGSMGHFLQETYIKTNHIKQY